MKEIVKVVDGKKWEDAIDKAYKKVNNKITVDGFRKGKASKEAVIKKYGENNLLFDAADLVLADVYTEMIKENNNLELAAQPMMSIRKIDTKGVEIVFELTLKPTVKLGKYKNLKAKREKVKVTKEEIDRAISELQNRYAETSTKEGKSKKDDTVVIDFEGFVNDVAFEGGKGENYNLKLGSNTFIPGFEDQLIGLKKGDKKDVVVTFPKNYGSEDLKGKEAIFKVEVKEVKETKVPDMDEEFFKDLNFDGINTVEALEKQIKENLMAHKEMDADNKHMDALLEEAASTVKVEIPDAMIDQELNRMVKQYEEHLKMQGLSIEQFYQFTNSDEEALRDQMREEANKRIVYRLMLEAIAKEEKIEFTDKEVDDEAEHLAGHYKMTKEEFLKAFGGIELVKYDMQMKKAMEILKEVK